jgi:hypothetical protein
MRSERFSCPGDLFGGAAQSKKAVAAPDSEPIQHVEIVSRVMQPLFMLTRRDRVRQQETASVRGISGPPRNTSQKAHDGGFHGILEEHGQVESLFSETHAEAEESAETAVRPPLVEHDDAIAKRVRRKQLRDQGIGDNGQLSVGEGRPQSSHGGSGHDRVADPIGGADQYFVDVR